MSGTKGQINGNAYGNGVYLADDANTSFGYMKYQEAWKKSIFHKDNCQLGVLAMCEIAIGHPDLSGQPNPYYVVAKEELIATRYFNLYPDSSGSSSIFGKQLKNVPKIEYD